VTEYDAGQSLPIACDGETLVEGERAPSEGVRGKTIKMDAAAMLALFDDFSSRTALGKEISESGTIGQSEEARRERMM